MNISFTLIPDEYKIVIAQYILFTYPIRQDYTLLIAGGVPLDIISWINIPDFIPSKLKDIDLTIKLDAHKQPSYYENIMKDIDTKIKNFYHIDHCLSKVGNFDGSVPPTSQFVFDKQTCIKIQNMPSFIQFLITFISNYNGKMECIDVVPFLDNNSVTNDIYNDAIRRDFTINCMYILLDAHYFNDAHLLDACHFNDVHLLDAHYFDNVDLSYDTQITLNIIDPLNAIQDLLSYTLRTPLDPGRTFKLDPRRLSRIIKMVEKMLRLFNQCHIAENLIDFINCDLKDVINLFYQQYPNREPLHNDILNVLNSTHFEQVVRKILIYPDMFKLFCGIDPSVDNHS